MQSLFTEYFAISGSLVNQRLVNKLHSLAYFHGFLLYLDSQPAGFAVCYESFSTYQCKKVLNIHDFMVAKNHRGMGYARLLLVEIEEYCRAMDYLKITLEVKTQNNSAQQLYRTFGFKDEQDTQANSLHWQKYLA